MAGQKKELRRCNAGAGLDRLLLRQGPVYTGPPKSPKAAESLEKSRLFVF